MADIKSDKKIGVSDDVLKLMESAEKYRVKTSWFGWNDVENREMAVKLYERVYTQLVMEKQYLIAGDVAVILASMCLDDTKGKGKGKGKGVDDSVMLDARDWYVKAAGSYNNGEDEDRAVRYYREAITISESVGSFSSCARFYDQLGSLYEQGGRFDEAVVAWLKCADYYEFQEGWISSVGQLSKVAMYYMREKDYGKAKEVLVRIVNCCRDHGINKYGMGDYLGLLAICEIYLFGKVYDFKAMERVLSEKIVYSSGFMGTVEYGMLEKCIEAFVEGDLGKYRGALADYDRIRKLDGVKVTAFHEILRLMERPVLSALDAGDGGDEVQLQ